MKKNIICLVLLLAELGVTGQQNHIGESFAQPVIPQNTTPVSNLIVITIDGFRWQELFNGADSLLINNDKYTRGSLLLKKLYWASNPEERRKKLMPFFWNIIGESGQLYGNRQLDNKVNVANPFAKSYPGYNEILTGVVDRSISSNKKTPNPNINIFEYLNGKLEFQNKVVAFTSWNVFPYILNENRSGLLINSGHDTLVGAALSAGGILLNRVENEALKNKTDTRQDQLTFLVAKEYLQQHHPRVVYLALGETDEFAHEGRYDLYLQQANQIDKMLADLWLWIQTTPGYADNTSIVITTDHGRGRKKRWTSHGIFITGSSQTWLAMLGPGILPLGEVKQPAQIYQKQLAQTIANLLGEEFRTGMQ